jgi:hypothetical protein
MFFVQDEVTRNNDAMFVLFLIVLSYNLFFLTLWTIRFTSVLLRVNVDKLRRFQICSWLNHISIVAYDEELELYKRQQSI